MKFAYADPPYYGYAKFYKGMHPEWEKPDQLSWHKDLIDRLSVEYSDGWALSLTSGNLLDILPLCPRDCRIGAWVKPFASYKPGVNPGYTWEPVIFRGGRKKRERTERTVRDHLACNITLQKGLTGAKPAAFNQWICNLLGYRSGIDEMHDLFPGTNGMEDYLTGKDIPLFKDIQLL